MKEQFKIFLSQLSKTNATLDYFVDFDKVTRNVHKIAIKLNQLNYLIGKENIEEAINELYEENPKVFEVLDILIAVRNKKTKTFNNNGKIVSLESYFSSPKGVLEYIHETRLAEVFKNKEINNLVDYVFGIEVGLDTNARKNRGGDNMSKAVLNEVARAYSEVAPKINQYENYEFVWITDGQGWLKAKNKLEEAYNIIPSVYNLTTLEEFVEKVKKEEIIKF